MSDQKKRYLWAIEWKKFFAEKKGEPPPSGMIFYSINLNHDANEKEFEKFMLEEAFPAVANVSTRALFYTPLYILKESVDEAAGPSLSGLSALEDVLKKLDSFGKRTSFTQLDAEPTSPDSD